MTNNLYKSGNANAKTTLTATYTAGTSATITIADGSLLPAAPNMVVVADSDNPSSKYAVVKYSTKSGNTLSGLSVLYGLPDLAQSFVTNDIVCRNITGVEWDELVDHVNNTTNPHNVTLQQIGAAAASHASQHASGGADEIEPADIGAAAATHAATHAVGGADPITPSAIGAATASHASQHENGGADEIDIDASQIVSGVIDIARIPRAAIENIVVVENDAARYALTSADVDRGDVVKVNSTQLMWAVVDLTHLDTDAGYVVYTASADWANITNKPLTYAPSGHVNSHKIGGGDSLAAADIGAAPANHTHTPESIAAADRNHTHAAADIGAAPANHTHTPASIGAATTNHTHTAADVGASPTGHTHTPASIGAATALHAGEHATTGTDPITPSAIGAAATGHTHTEYAGVIHSDTHAVGGADPITPSAIGASPTGHTHTGYAATVHASTHNAGSTDPITPSAIGAAAASHTHTPEEAGAAPAAHTHDAPDLQPAIDGTTIYINQDGKLEAAAGSGAPPASSITYDHTQSGLMAQDVQSAIDEVASGTVSQQQADWTQSNEASVTFIKNKPRSMTPTAHAATHAYGAADEIEPADIGAATAGHTHTGYAATVHASTHASGGTDELTPSAIGAAPSAHTHTPASIGAAAANHTHDGNAIAVDGTTIIVNENDQLAAVAQSAQQQADWNEADTTAAPFIKNKPQSMTPTTHATTHASGGTDELTPSAIGAAPSAHTHTPASIGAAAATHASQHASGGADPISAADIGLGNVTDGAQINVLEAVQANSVAVPIVAKTVNITSALLGLSDAAHALTPLVNQTIATSAWSLQSTPDVANYPYRAAIAYTGCTADHYGQVVYTQADAESGNLANVCQTASGVVYVYAKAQPAETINVATVAAWEV